MSGVIAEQTVVSPQRHFQKMQAGAIPFDLLLTNGPHEYEVHSVVVGAVSPVLLDRITSLSEGQRRVISFDFPDRSDVFQRIVDFCYGIDLVMVLPEIDVIYLISTALELADVAEAATEMLKRSFQETTVVPSLWFVFRSHGDVSPHIRFIQENFSEMMYHEDVLSLPFDVLDQVLATDEIAVEDEDTLGRWVAHVIRVRSMDCRDLVKRLRVGDLLSEVIVELCSCEEVDAPALVAESRRSRSGSHFPGRRLKLSDRGHSLPVG
jgi:hypothetical protein